MCADRIMDWKENNGSSRVPSSSPERIVHRPVFGILVVVVLGLLSYANTFHAPFVFDDRPAITDNRLVKDLGNFLAGLEGYESNPRRYVAYLSFAVNYRIGGLHVAGYHAFNLFVHLANALLVLALVRLTFRTPFMKGSVPGPSSGAIAFFSALFFVVHPVQTQAVTYIVQRMTSLATLFSLASLYLYARWRIREDPAKTPWNRSIALYAASLFCLVLAMRTKEIAFTIPVLIALYDWFFFGKTRTMSLVPVLLTLLIIPAGMLHIGKPLGEVLSDVTAVTRVQSDLSRWEYLATQCTVVITYLRLLVLPVNQNLDYDYPVERSFLSGHVLLSAAVLLSIVFLGVVLYLRSRPGRESSVPELRLTSFGIAWFFITLLVESSIIPIADVIFEHRIYMPSAGFFMATSVGVIAAGVRLERNIPGIKRAFVATMVLASIILAGATFTRNEIWTDDVRLWSDVVDKSPRKSRPHYNLAVSHYLKGDMDKAIRHYSTSIQLNPFNVAAHENLGTLYANTGRLDMAVRQYKTALSIKPGYYEARYNLANTYRKMGEAHFAEREYHAVLSINPEYGPAHNNLGLLYAQQGRFDDASRHFQAAVAIDPSDAEAWNNLGIVHAHQERYEDAVRHFREALRWSKDNAEIHNNLGTAYLRLERLKEAVREFQAALRIDPGHSAARRNLAEAQKRISEYP